MTVAQDIAVSLLTGGGDRPYVFGLTTELMSKSVGLDIIGSDELDSPEFHGKAGVSFLNLRGDQFSAASFLNKIKRVLFYYARLIGYAAAAKPKIFHILWNNKFEMLDRTLLMLYYRVLGKKIVLTVHNVNTRKRDSKDSWLNRLTLRTQYHLADQLFVHTEKMKCELVEEFGVTPAAVTVIPFGINNAVPNTCLTASDAKRKLGIPESEKTILFFGNIAPYKGLEYLTAAFKRIATTGDNYRLIVAGRPKNCDRYWSAIEDNIRSEIQSGRILLRAEFIPDDETEVYFKAADVAVLPYTQIYQSGVLFLAHSFGLPVIAADVGSLKEEIVEGTNGYVFTSEDEVGLARMIERYFASDLYANLSSRRQEIHDHAVAGHSWNVVGDITTDVYSRLMGRTDLGNCAANSYSCAQRARVDS